MKLSLTTRAADPSRTRRATAMVVSAALAVGAVAVLSAPAAIAAVHTLRSAAAAPITGQPPSAPVQQTGTLPDGATWLVEKSRRTGTAPWCCTGTAWSHPARTTRPRMHRIRSPESTCWTTAMRWPGRPTPPPVLPWSRRLQDQADLVGVFAQEVAPPTTTIAWGTSLGAMVTAGLLERHPELFDGGLAMCGPLAGGVGLMDSYLDTVFALKTLLAPDVALVHLGEGLFDQIGALQAAVESAQTTAAGRAKIALAAAIGDFPGWAHADNPRPAPDDLATQQQAQFEHIMDMAFFGLALGADIDGKFGGNPARNVGVDYAKLLQHSNSNDEVHALYEQAGLPLKNDLRSLKRADRIEADPGARAKLAEVSNFTGSLSDPMLTLHTAGDNQVVVEHENAYARTVRQAGSGRLLRQAFTERAFHCAFTPAEMLSALGTLTDRVKTGSWKQTADADTLQARAIALGPDLNVHIEDDPTQPIPTAPQFTELDPGRFPRPFDRN